MTEGVGGEGEEQSPRSSGERSRRLLRCKRGWSASRCCLPPRRVTATPLGGRGDDYDNDVRWEEQDMPYLSGDRRRAERGEGNVDEGVDDEHVDGRVRGPRLADTRNGHRGATVTKMTTLRREYIASHPTDKGDVRAGGEAAFRRHPVRVRGLLVRCGRRERTTTMTSDGPTNGDEKGVMPANYGLMPPFFLQLN